MIIVDLLLATICFAGTCEPALVGTNTQQGEYSLKHVYTDEPLYGGDILVYRDTPTTYYAIHRVWLGKPKQQRIKRLNSSNPKDRVITSGCINVSPDVYERIVACCVGESLLIK